MSGPVALYIDPRGPYPTLLGPERCWDEQRDARLYEGPDPVVAHPPCGPWGRLKHLYKGNEHDCAPRALSQVCAFGGVLEHPAGSLLWADAGLPAPGERKQFVDCEGFTLEIDQCDWGHVARKRTWLFIVGLSYRAEARVRKYANWRRGTGTPTHWVSGFRSSDKRRLYPEHYKKSGCAVPEGIKVCSSQQRRRTPPLLAAWLIELAGSAQPKRRAV